MTRTTGWRRLAEAFSTPPAQRTQRQAEIAEYGLCFGWWRLTGEYQDKSPLYTLHESPVGRFFWPLPADEERATFAALMAAMTQRERDQLVKGL